MSSSLQRPTRGTTKRRRSGFATIEEDEQPTDPQPQRLRDFAWLRRVRDRIDREYAQPLDVEALAHGVHMSAGYLSRQFMLACAIRPTT